MPPPLSSEYAPAGETEADLFIERSNFNGVGLSCVAYGILFTLAVQCFQGLHENRRRGKDSRLWIDVYVFFILAMGTVGLAGNMKYNQMTYIDYRDFPGGPNAFTVAFYATPINLASFVTYVIMSWLTDGLVLYRFFVIYNRNLLAAAIPALIYLGGIGCSIGLIIAIVHVENSFWGAASVNFGIAYWSISAALNILFTLLIIAKLLVGRRNVRGLNSGFSDKYLSVIAMLVESAALYSGWALVFLIFFARASPVQNILLPPLGQIQGIAPLLILLRVISGRAWNDKPAYSTTGASYTFGGTKPTTSVGGAAIPMNTLESHGTGVNIEETVITLRDPVDDGYDKSKYAH